MTVPVFNIKDDLKSLRICHGSVKRLFKDIKYYENEKERLTEDLEKLKSNDACSSKIKLADEILQENLRVIPTIQKSLNKNLEKLFDTVTKKFDKILFINENRIEFLCPYNEHQTEGGLDKLKNSFLLYEELYKEVSEINQTLESVFLKFKNESMHIGCYNFGGPVKLPQEECVDI